jgi:hypothetical protein
MDKTLYTSYSAVDFTGVAPAIEMVDGGNTQSTARMVEDNASEKFRTVIDLSVSPAVPNSAAPGGYTQSRRTVVSKEPKTLANDNVTVNTVRTQVAFDPETTPAELGWLITRHLHSVWLLLDEDNFFVEGSTK